MREPISRLLVKNVPLRKTFLLSFIFWFETGRQRQKRMNSARISNNAEARGKRVEQMKNPPFFVFDFVHVGI
jgi:hypothetical protein